MIHNCNNKTYAIAVNEQTESNLFSGCSLIMNEGCNCAACLAD